MSYRALYFLRKAFQKELLSKSCKTLQVLKTSCAQFSSEPQLRHNLNQFKTETNLVYPSDPETFGTLSGRPPVKLPEDEGDAKEEEYLQNIPLRSQQLTTKQYADIIKQFVKHKRIKEAIDVLEVRMIKEDRVQPENYIYNIVIGACADVGYTKKAFKLYNDMKKRALRVTGDTYTCLFDACANSPWPADGIKNATHLRNLMQEKRIEPNLTNYNAMIKAFGRCGDLSTAFQIVDEMVSKKIKIRVHTFNFLLQSCITDKENGLRHAIIVWRRMLLKREKPNIYSFNLMLKCVKECNFGTTEDIMEALSILKQSPMINTKPTGQNQLQITSEENKEKNSTKINVLSETNDSTKTNELSETQNENVELLKLQFVNEKEKSLLQTKPSEKFVPNLLAKNLYLDEVISLKEVKTPQDRFKFIGGLSGFLQEMKVYNVKPDFKTIALLVHIIPNTEKAENELMEIIKEHELFVDIEFYNNLIRKRCYRFDYKGALEVKTLIEKENKLRKKKHPWKRELRLKHNLLTYGALAMTCKTKEDAVQMLQEMEEKQIKVNIEILGSMLSQAKSHFDFTYVCYLLKMVKTLSLRPNEVFLRHLEKFNAICDDRRKLIEKGKNETSMFGRNHDGYRSYCERWLQEMKESRALDEEHPWTQFKQNQPETVQRQKIIEPVRIYYKKKNNPKKYRA